MDSNAETGAENRVELKPVFDGGAFQIDVLSTEPEGLEVATKLSLRRRQGIWEPGEKLPLSENQRKKIGVGVNSEVEKALKTAVGEIPPIAEDPELVQARIDSYREQGFSDDKVSKIEKSIKEKSQKIARKRRIASMSGQERANYKKELAKSLKVGIRNPEIEGNQLMVDVVPVPFHFYKEIRHPSEQPETLKLADLCGTALILETADGKYIVQKRHKDKNRAYKNIPGASAAGLFDGIPNSRLPGTLSEIKTGGVKKNVLKETMEELGIDSNVGRLHTIDNETIEDFAKEKAAAEIGEENVADIKITGFSRDLVTIHSEFMLSAKTKHTSSQMREIARERLEKGIEEDDWDFSEEFFFIEATPQAVEVLLTQIKCPLPPTHSAAFISAAYLKVIGHSGLTDAKVWLGEMQMKVKENWDDINNRVKNFYEENPNLVEERPDANHEGYDSHFTPEEQGLPSLEDELERTGLSKVETITKPLPVWMG